MTDAARIAVAVCEDQPKILKAQVKSLQEHADIEVCATALSGEAALSMLEKRRPHVLLQDLGLPGISGIEVTHEVKRRWPEVEVLIFTIFDEEEKVLDAVKAGASGYLLKGTPADKIVEAIREVHAGGSVIQPNLARRLLRLFQVAPAEPRIPERAQPGRRLSERETEILRLIAKGLSNAEAASVLGLSRATVRTHLEHIYEKFDVTNRVEAVTEGLRTGLIQV
jgi:DNA-binding NarL/FixJ family response regulator